MLLASILCTAGTAILFCRLCRDTWTLLQPLILATVILSFPPRWLSFRSTGSTEAPCLLFEQDGVGRASVMGVLAPLTRSPGTLAAPAFALTVAKRRRWRSLQGLAIPPAALAGFSLYGWSCAGSCLEYSVRKGDKAGAFQPFGLLPHLPSRGAYRQVERVVLLAFAQPGLLGEWTPP